MRLQTPVRTNVDNEGEIRNQLEKYCDEDKN